MSILLYESVIFLFKFIKLVSSVLLSNIDCSNLPSTDTLCWFASLNVDTSTLVFNLSSTSVFVYLELSIWSLV